MEPTYMEVGLIGLMCLALTAASLFIAARIPGRGRYLCEDCRFNNADDCSKQDRPIALECTSYRKADGATTRAQ